jgi:dienelactone hydrolase
VRKLAAAVLLAVVAAGCGNGSDDDSDDPTGGDADDRSTTLERVPDHPGTSIERQTDLTTHELTVDDDGFAGTLVLPERDGPRPAVLLLGGSEGGRPIITAEGLADAGYVSLALAYFDAPGLPDELSGIPLEYFETALRWLGQQPEVDPDHVLVWGASRGGEAALLVGATYTDLVDGVVAAVPANVVTCGLPACDRSAWTLDGEELPYVDDFRSGYYEMHPEAEIPVERIAGPVLVTCGGRDQVWPSCAMSAAIIDRLDRHGHEFHHEVADYPNAGHRVSIPPALPLTEEAIAGSGGTVSANDAAREDAWERTLAFLADASA